MTNLFCFFLKHPKKTLLTIGILTALFSFSIFQLKYDFTIEQLFAENKVETKNYFDFQEEFSREDNILMIAHQIPKQIEESFIDSLSQVINIFKNSNYFNEVLSLIDIYDNNLEGKIQFSSSSLINIVSKDLKYGSIWLKLKDNHNSYKKRSKVIEYIKSNTADFNWEWTYSGIPVVRNTYVEYMIEDNIKFIPPVAIILIISLGLLFRHWLYVVLPLVTVIITACWILGIMSLTGRGLNVMTYMVPTLLFIIGVSDSIHFLSRFNLHIKKGEDVKSSLEITIRDMGVALFLTSLTTAIGFLALLYSSISIVQEFGFFIACGVFIAYLLTLTFIPSCLILLKDKISVIVLSSSDKRSSFLKSISNIVMLRPKQIILSSIFFIIVSLIGAFSISTGSSLLSDLHPESGLYIDLKNVEKWFGGILPVEIIITKEDTVERPIYDKEIMRYTEKLQKYIYEIFPYSNWISLQRVLEKFIYELDPNIDFPPDQEILDQVYILTQDKTRELINFEENKIRISGLLPDLSSEVLDNLEDSLNVFAANNFPSWLSIHMTGTMPVALKTNNHLIADLFSGFGLAFIFISLVMGLLFWSFRIGLISILPNLIPIIFAAGYLGFAGIPVRPPIAITFSICLGIAVDDSLHFLFRFWQERKKSSNIKEVISNTIETTGLAMLTSTIVLVSGFLVITVSTFIPTAQFGIISAITLTVALLIDITLLPALLILFPIEKKKIND
tara:strand:+ start:111 stop:2297 length:2187 start_codon:yes stop_codon:yes gene_type:complete